MLWRVLNKITRLNTKAPIYFSFMQTVHIIYSFATSYRQLCFSGKQTPAGAVWKSEQPKCPYQTKSYHFPFPDSAESRADSCLGNKAGWGTAGVACQTHKLPKLPLQSHSAQSKRQRSTWGTDASRWTAETLRKTWPTELRELERRTLHSEINNWRHMVMRKKI